MIGDNAVTRIGDYAFYNCTGLTSINIPDSVTRIGDYAFYNCNSLDSIRFEGKSPVFSDLAFRGYNKDVLYPYGFSGWNSVIQSSYGGNMKWVLYSKGTLEELKISSLPKKTLYCLDETADYSGLELTATWSDGYSVVITPDSETYNISFSGFSTEPPVLKQ